jgi:hypothetical protein
VDTATNRFTGVTRAAKGTTAAAGNSGDEIVWIEHDIWILYGNTDVSAPSVDDNYKPAFRLDTSTNTSWDYDEFGEDDGLRTAAWSKQTVDSPVYWYNGNHGSSADPWDEIGLHFTATGTIDFAAGRWYCYNPCGIVSASFQNAEKYISDDPAYVDWDAGIESSNDGSSWTREYDIAEPTAGDVWETWNRSETLASGSRYVGLYLEHNDDSFLSFLECADVTVTLDSSNTPAVVLGGEQGNYSLDATLTIVEDGEDGDAIRLQATIALDETLEVDCEERTVTYLKDNSNQFQALSLQDPVNRNWWLRLPGHWDGGKTVQLRYDEDGVAGVELTVTFAARYL